jgi:hypothetical protein
MGGIVARMFAANANQAKRVNRLITMGTPFQGSASVLKVVAEGWGPIPNAIAGRVSVVRRTILSFPSIYELFPDYRFDRACCRLGARGSANAETLDIYDGAIWDKYGWLPPEYRSGQRRDLFESYLKDAKRLHTEIAKRQETWPPELRFIGSRRETPLFLWVKPDATSVEHWEFQTAGGDGTVSAWSAADASADNSLAGSRPAFAVHATIFTDEGLKETLVYELTETPAPHNERGGIVATTEGSKRLHSVAISTDRYFLEKPGDTVTVRVSLRFDERIGQASANLVVQSDDGMASSVGLTNVTSSGERATDILAFSAALPVTGAPGAKRLDVRIPGAGIQSFYVEIAE